MVLKQEKNKTHKESNPTIQGNKPGHDDFFSTHHLGYERVMANNYFCHVKM